MKAKNAHRPLLRNHKKAKMYMIVILLMAFLYASGMLPSLILSLHEFEYPGAFAAGLFYSYGMTTPLAIAVFIAMAPTMDPLLLALLGASGAAASDIFMLRSFADEVGRKIKITKKLEFAVPEARSLPQKLTLSAIGGLILMSPLPDEIAVVFLGISRIDAWKFAILSFVFKFMGILAIVGFSLAFIFPPS